MCFINCFKSSKNNNNQNNNDKSLKLKKIIKILYVEDLEIYSNLMAHILQKYLNNEASFEIIWKTNNQEAYEYIINNPDDIGFIFVDRLLKNESGDELIKKIKDENLFPLNKILIISSLHNEVDKYKELGINYFIKPLDISEFVELVKKIII